MRLAKFSIGQNVKHRFYPFRGVIYDVDPTFGNTEEWYQSIPADVRPTKDQPFYHLFADNAQGSYEAYVSEQNLLPDGEGPSTSLRTGIRARFIVHLSDFTTDGSPEPEHLDEAFLEQCVARPEDVSHSIWVGKAILIVKVSGATSISKVLANRRALRAIRNFNLTHMNRGRNAYQASHCYSVADSMLEE